ncbi:MAG TPA: TetR/AcrR family transcriptional regulator [Acidimicrobiia bacterium]|nr:TetR/AcrR family transcriptional regulator [Acidimicrobiia bacterium]
MPRIRAASIDEHKELTRRALLEAAWRVIEDAGTAEVPLGEIALLAGVGRTTFYDYFEDRDDVIASLVEDKLPDVIAGMIEAVPSGLGPVERLTHLTVSTVEFVATDRVFGVILHREVGRMGLEAQRRIRESHAQLATELAATYTQGVDDGVFRPIPGYLAGRLIQDTIMSAARVLIEDESRRDLVTGEVVRFLLGGLRKLPSTPD